MPKLQDPPPKWGGTDWWGAYRLAKQNPAEWVLVHTFKNANSASTTATRNRNRFPEVEVISRGSEVYIRTQAVETK